MHEWRCFADVTAAGGTALHGSVASSAGAADTASRVSSTGTLARHASSGLGLCGSVPCRRCEGVRLFGHANLLGHGRIARGRGCREVAQLAPDDRVVAVGHLAGRVGERLVVLLLDGIAETHDSRERIARST